MVNKDTQSEREVDALRIDAASIKPVAAQVEKRSKFWIGLIEDCPFPHLSIVGVTFHKQVEPLREKKLAKGKKKDPVEIQMERFQRKGEVVFLTDEQIDAVKAKATSKVVRMQSGTCQLLNSDSKYYNAEKDDVQVGRYIYVVPASGSMPASYVNGGEPPPLIR